MIATFEANVTEPSGESIVIRGQKACKNDLLTVGVCLSTEKYCQMSELPQSTVAHFLSILIVSLLVVPSLQDTLLVVLSI